MNAADYLTNNEFYRVGSFDLKIVAFAGVNMKGWQKNIMLTIKEGLETLGLEYHNDYFVKTLDSDVWGGVCLSISRSSRHLTLSPFVSLQCPRIWKLAKKFESDLDVSNWQCLHRRDFFDVVVPDDKKKPEVINVSFWSDSSQEEVMNNVYALLRIAESVVSSYITPRLSLQALMEAEEGNLAHPGIIKYSHPVLFMEAGRSDLAIKSIELQLKRGRLSEIYVRRFKEHYALEL